MKAKKFTPLTPNQRSYLAQLARTAHARLAAVEAISESFDDWRKREAMQASGGYTISEAPRQAFDDLEQHFLALQGATGKAYERATGPDNELRTIAHEITVTARTLDLSDTYVAGICRRMFQRDTWTTAKQAKSVLIALKAKLKKSQHQTLSA